MQLNKNQTVEVNIRDLIFHLLYRWRGILIAALIGAVVLCGYQYLSIKKVHDAGKQTKEERQYEIDLQQYRENLATNRNAVKVYSKLIQDQNEYLEKSVYIKLSPQNAWVASKKYLIKVDQSVMDALPQGSPIDPADTVLPAYSAPLSGISDEEALKEAFGTDETEYISELVITKTNSQDNTVTIYVLGETRKSVLAEVTLLHQQMEMISESKAKETVPHQLSLVSESEFRGIDSIASNLASKQETLAKTTEENQKTLQTARQQLDKLEEEGEPTAPGMHLPKMAVIGFILGAFILLIIYSAGYIFRGRINHTGELTERYGLPLLGELPRSGRLHACRGLDKLFSGWELGKDAPGKETVYDNICALISEKEEAETILLVSSLPEVKLSAVKEALAGRLPEKTIKIVADMPRSSEAVPEAVKADKVVIVEERHFSRVKDIDRMAESLIFCKANVIGCIAL